MPYTSVSPRTLHSNTTLISHKRITDNHCFVSGTVRQSMCPPAICALQESPSHPNDEPIKMWAYFQYPCLYCWCLIPKYINPYPMEITPTTAAPTTGGLNGGSNTVWGCPSGGRVALSSPHTSFALCILGEAVDICRLLVARAAVRIAQFNMVVVLCEILSERSSSNRPSTSRRSWKAGQFFCPLSLLLSVVFVVCL